MEISKSGNILHKEQSSEILQVELKRKSAVGQNSPNYR